MKRQGAKTAGKPGKVPPRHRARPKNRYRRCRAGVFAMAISFLVCA
jgi:hypothetical protein